MSTLNEIPAAVPQRGWFARHWRWFVPLAAGLLALAYGGLRVGAFLWQGYARKSSPPYTMALSRVQHDPKVIERLGQPIMEDSWFPQGSIHLTGDSGTANLVFQVSGPMGKASVQTHSRRIAGQWGITDLEVRLADGQRIAIDAGPGDGQEAPKFQPGGEAPKFQPGVAPAKPPAAPAPKDSVSEIRIEIPSPGK